MLIEIMSTGKFVYNTQVKRLLHCEECLEPQHPLMDACSRLKFTYEICYGKHMESTVTTKLGNNGRFVIPGEIRKRLGLKDGDQLSVGIENGRIVILTPEVLLAEFYALTQNVRSEASDIVQELIDERRQEAANE